MNVKVGHKKILIQPFKNIGNLFLPGHSQVLRQTKRMLQYHSKLAEVPVDTNNTKPLAVGS